MKTQRTEMRLTIRIISHVIKWYNNMIIVIVYITVD